MPSFVAPKTEKPTTSDANLSFGTELRLPTLFWDRPTHLDFFPDLSPICRRELSDSTVDRTHHLVLRGGRRDERDQILRKVAREAVNRSIDCVLLRFHTDSDPFGLLIADKIGLFADYPYRSERTLDFVLPRRTADIFPNCRPLDEERDRPSPILTELSRLLREGAELEKAIVAPYFNRNKADAFLGRLIRKLSRSGQGGTALPEERTLCLSTPGRASGSLSDLPLFSELRPIMLTDRPPIGSLILTAFAERLTRENYRFVRSVSSSGRLVGISSPDLGCLIELASPSAEQVSVINAARFCLPEIRSERKRLRILRRQSAELEELFEEERKRVAKTLSDSDDHTSPSKGAEFARFEKDFLILLFQML